MPEVPRDLSFCRYVIQEPKEPLIVNNAKQDSRVCDSPFTQTENPVIFCVSLPLIDEEMNKAIGTLCVVDHMEREISEQQLFSLRCLAQFVVQTLSIRRKKIREEQLVQELSILKDAVHFSSDNIFVIDPATMLFVGFNLAVLQDLKYTAPELEKMGPHDIAPLLNKEAWQETYADLLNRKKLFCIVETTHRKKTGEEILVEIYIKVGKQSNSKRLVIASARDVTQRKQFEQNLFNAVVETEERERNRIAGELHDGVCQYLATARLNISTAENMLDTQDDSIAYAFFRSKSLLDQAIHLTRRVSHELMPADINKEGLLKTLQVLVDDLNGTDAITYILTVEGDNKEPNNQVSLHLLRIVQEFVRNSQKHAQANYIQLKLRFSEKSIVLYISDDGKGFDMDKVKEKGVGLLSMVKRIEAIGGQYHYEAKAGKGVTLSIEAPL